MIRFIFGIIFFSNIIRILCTKTSVSCIVVLGKINIIIDIFIYHDTTN